VSWFHDMRIHIYDKRLGHISLPSSSPLMGIPEYADEALLQGKPVSSA
ncbi:MAG: hypothetical protein ACI9HY_002237, partial [Planctomycetaceae bacterium]